MYHEKLTYETLPIPKGDASFVARNIDPCSKEDKIRKRGKGAFFNQEVMKRTAGSVLFIVEGEFDALSIEECGYPAVAIGSTSNVRSFVNLVKQIKLETTLAICMDNDASGESATAEFVELLQQNKIRYTLPNVNGDYNDPNEHLVKNRESFDLALQAALTLEPEPFRDDIKGSEHAQSALNEIIDANVDVDLLDYKLDDLGNFERVNAVCGENIRYLSELKQWFCWNGIVWDEDKTGEVFRKTASVVRALQNQALENLKACKGDDEREARAKTILHHANKTATYAKIVATEQITGKHKFIVPDQLDSHEMLLTCANGTIDLKSGAFHEPRREDFITKFSHVPYNKDIKAPVFDAFLKRIFDNDDELIDYVQRAFGYSLTGNNKKNCFFICHGDGANGKSTLFNVVAHVVKDYCEYIPMDILMEAKKKGGSASPELARARGMRIVFATESEDMATLNEAVIKNISGTDPINVRLLYSSGITYKPNYKIWIATNHRPIIKGTDHAIWRRVKLIPFAVQIPEDEQDPELGDKLRAESEGILAWLIEGAAKFFERGLEEAKAVTMATKEYRADMDVLSGFIEDCTVKASSSESIGANILYKVFGAYATQNAMEPMTETKFGLRMKARKDITKAKTNMGMRYEGIILSEYGDKLLPKPDVPGWISD